MLALALRLGDLLLAELADLACPVDKRSVGACTKDGANKCGPGLV